MAGLIPSHRKLPEQRHRRGGDANLVQLAAAPPAVPPPPGGLRIRQRRRWAAFWGSASALAVDPASDLPRLERWIEQVDQYERTRDMIARAPIVTGSMGQLVANPLVNYLAQLETQIARAETEFGMTPMSRLRLGITAAAGRIAAERARAAVVRAAVTADDDDDRRAQVLGISREHQP